MLAAFSSLSHYDVFKEASARCSQHYPLLLKLHPSVWILMSARRDSGFGVVAAKFQWRTNEQKPPLHRGRGIYLLTTPHDSNIVRVLLRRAQ